MKKAITLTLALGGVIAFTFLVMPSLAPLASETNDPYPPPYAYPVADFELLPLQTVRVSTQMDTVKYPLYLKRIGSFHSTVLLKFLEVPRGTQGSLEPEQVVPSGRSVATLVATELTPVGRHTFSIAGQGGGKEHTAMLTLVVIEEASDDAIVGPEQGNKLELGGAEGVTMTVDIPAGAFTQSTTITLTLLNGSETPTDIPPPGQAFVRTFRIEAGAPLADGQSVILTIHYQDGEVAWLEENLLQVFYWDEETQNWRSDGIHVLSLDTEANVMVIQLDHFTDFTLTGFVSVEKIYLPLVIR